MDSTKPQRPRPTEERESYLKPIVSLVTIPLLLLAIAARTFYSAESAKSAAVVVSMAETLPEASPAPASLPTKPVPKAKSAPVIAAAAPQLDKAAVARAKAGLDSANSDRSLAEARLADVELSLERAKQTAEHDQAFTQTLLERAADSKSRIDRSLAEGGHSADQRDALRKEIGSLAKTAKPRAKPLLDKSPVSKPIKGNEVHFEVRQGRVTPIEIDRLVELVKADGQIRMKVGAIRGRPIASTVGPIGAFSMRYELGLMMGDSGIDVLDLRNVSFGLRSWEIVPESDNRGETLEGVVRPGSDYANVITRLTPGKSSLTFWVYPDGFELYRRLRDDLHARGFLVAARPLPEGLSIQASPSGSASAAQ